MKLEKTGIKNVRKTDNGYIFLTEDTGHSTSYLDILLKHMEADNIPIIVEDQELFERSILESRKKQYSTQCRMMGVINNKDPDSFYDLYSEWPVPDGKWSIVKFDGSERFTIRRKSKVEVMRLVDDLNNGRGYPYKIIKNDYSNKYGVGMEIKK